MDPLVFEWEVCFGLLQLGPRLELIDPVKLIPRLQLALLPLLPPVGAC